MEQKERTRTSISPLGLNKSTPDNVVEDGALKVCHNLRFANGAWRNVQEFEQKSVPAALRGKDILYAHPIGGKTNYLTKNTTQSKTTRVTHYGMRSQPMAIAPKGIDEGSSATPTADFGDVVANNPMSDILNKVSEIYYLDAPLSVVRSNPNGVLLYDKKLDEIGSVAGYHNGKLSYFIQDGVYTEGYLALHYANVAVSRLGEVSNKVLYFLNETITTDTGKNAVIVKSGDNYVYYGKVVAADNGVYAIEERGTGITVSCAIPTTTYTEVRFSHIIALSNADYLYYNVYEENALVMFSSTGGVGYLHNTAEEYSEAIPKFTLDANNNKLFYSYDEKRGTEVKFKRNDVISTSEIKYESDEDYIARYKRDVNIDAQIWGYELKPCLTYVSPEERFICLSPFYSWDMYEAEPLPYIPFFYADEALNISEEVTKEVATISAWDESGSFVGNVGKFSNNFTLDHFGNMLIVRDLDSRSTHYYVFSEGAYQTYGSAGKADVSFSVSIKDSIPSPKMTDVPMYYKTPNISAEDGSLDGRMFVGAAEPIAPLGAFNSNSNLLLSHSDKYFRGELAIFVVARAKDGSEIFRTPPQMVRSETLLNEERDIFVFIPETIEERTNLDDGNPDNDVIVHYKAEEFYPYCYLVWNRQYLNHAFFLGDATRDSAYKRYNTWKNKYNRYEKNIQPILDSVRASDMYTLNVDIEADGQNIYDLAIYATRLYPLFTLEGETLRTNNVDVLNEPFYLMKTLSGNERSYTITYSDLENIETKTDLVYKPTQSGETSFFATHAFEYNNCYHSYDIEVLKPSLNPDSLLGSTENTVTDMVTTRLYDGAAYYAHYSAGDVFANDARELHGFALSQPHMIAFSHPLRNIIFGKVEGNRISATGKFTPEYSTALDCSYIINKEDNLYDSDIAGEVRPNGEKWTQKTYSQFVQAMQNASRTSRKYKPIVLQNLAVAEDISILPHYPIKVSNRIQVSDTNNPTANPYERSYRIGSLNNEIIAINSAAIEMSDAKFGEFPLYVFTKEGIFAMQSGTENLYSAIIPISKDVAINPNTLAVNGAVLFFTDKGLHMLSQNGVQLISAGLHEENNRIPEWMYTCRMVHLPEYNEVMCALMDGDETIGKAYVLSLDNSCWSEREVPSGYILNNNEVVGLQTIANLENESNEVKKVIEMETRPIKLGAGKELKRLETLILRFEADKDEELEVTIKGSIDGVEYKDLRKVSANTNTDVLIRRTPASVKYLKFAVKGVNISSGIRIIGFDTEHYLRFLRKMR